MLDKLFVRVRSWLHNDPTGVLGDEVLHGERNGNQAGKRDQHAAQTGAASMTPPPLPPDAWNESESGMVITESGIIIIDPAAMEAVRSAPPARPTGRLAVPEDAAWALPSLPRPGATSPVPTPMSAASTTTSSSPHSDWDEVLARARANINSPTTQAGRQPDPHPRKTGNGSGK